MSPKYDAAFPEYNAHGIFPAAHNVISVLRKDLVETNRLLNEAKNSDEPYAVDEYEDLFYKAAYGEAALSHAAVGALAPMIEAVLAQEFAFLGTIYESHKDKIDINSASSRWTNYEQSIRKFWSVRKFYNNGRWVDNIAEGLTQLSDALQLAPFFGDVCFDKVKALFVYRNFALHNGYETDVRTRQKFRDRITSSGWQDYFCWGTTGGEPWLFSMKDDFMNECYGIGPGLHYAFDRIFDAWTDDGLTDEERDKAWREFYEDYPKLSLESGD